MQRPTNELDPKSIEKNTTNARRLLCYLLRAT